mmetsp:Transcript_5597/g.12946  ORF Transcript_5597/g.12946 Transcript_5597/m.12946 type:complete len:459 (+) Transcript_5597:373-1749(+)
MAAARRAGFSPLKMPEPTKTPSQPSSISSATSAGVARPPAAKVTTGSRPAALTCSTSSTGTRCRLAYAKISSSRIATTVRISEKTERAWRTAWMTFPVPALPLSRIMAAPSAMRRSASPKSWAPQTKGMLKGRLWMWLSSSAAVSTSDSSMQSTQSASSTRDSAKWPMRDLAITGSDVAAITSLIIFGSDIRATPPSRLMSAGMRSSAMTAHAPALSAMRACSPSTTSMITPPCWKTGKARLTAVVPTPSSYGVGCHGALLVGGGSASEVVSTPATLLRKNASHESSLEISGWKQVASRLDCRTATTRSSGSEASTSTPSPRSETAGARIKYERSDTPASAASPLSANCRKRESICRPKALRSTPMLSAPMSGWPVAFSKWSARRIMPAHTPHTGFDAVNVRSGWSRPASMMQWPIAVDSPPGRMSASTSASSSAVRTSMPLTPLCRPIALRCSLKPP